MGILKFLYPWDCECNFHYASKECVIINKLLGFFFLNNYTKLLSLQIVICVNSAERDSFLWARNMATRKLDIKLLDKKKECVIIPADVKESWYDKEHSGYQKKNP